MSYNPFNLSLLQIQQLLRHQQQNELQQHLHREQQLQQEQQHEQRLLDHRLHGFQQQQLRQQQQQQLNLLLFEQQWRLNQQEPNTAMQPSMLSLLSSLSQQPPPPVNRYSHSVLPPQRPLLFTSSETTQALISQNLGQVLYSVPAPQSASSSENLCSQPMPPPSRQIVHQQPAKKRALTRKPTPSKVPQKRAVKKKSSKSAKVAKVDIRKKITKSPATSSVRRSLVSKIDREPPSKNWNDFSMRSIPTDAVLHTVQYHAYILSNVYRITYISDESTGGGPFRDGKRVYKCTTGIEDAGSTCTWKLTLRKKRRTTRWNMAQHPGECTCLYQSHYCINVPTLINLPEFRNLVQDNLYGNKVMTIGDEALKKQLSSFHGVQNMNLPNFTEARRSVQQYFNTQVIDDDFLDFPGFLNLLIERNKNNVTVCLQTELDSNSFFRFFLGMPICKELGKLTMDVLVVDCFHFKTSSFDGVCMNIVTRSGFGRTRRASHPKPDL